MNISTFKPTLVKLETLIRQLEINLGLEHKRSPFEEIVADDLPPLHDRPAQACQPAEKPKVEKQVEKKEKQPKEKKQQQQQQQKQPEPPKPDYGKFGDLVNVDFRVGELKKVWKHPESEKLYCEQIDIGTGVREIASGLQQYIPIEEMTGQVVVLVNLKGRKLANFMSEGMVMCASTLDHNKVELLRPPAGSVVGERVKIQGFEHFFEDAPREVMNPKKKTYENVAPFLKTDGTFQATFDGHLFVTKAGVVTCKSIGNGNIS